MLYIVSSLVTEGGSQAYSLIGSAETKEKAAELAAEIYKDYNRNASFQNIEMITEWLATRRKYSFRRDKEHRLQLAITELPETGGALPEGTRLVFSAEAEADELSRRMSQALFEGHHVAERGGKTASCPIEKA